MLLESETFSGSKDVQKTLVSPDGVFRYCIFQSASLEGGNFGDVFLSCEFRDVELYWGLFNGAVLFNCAFERCKFRGTSFAGCRFVECKFSDCEFLKDNLGAPCGAPNTKLFSCDSERCEGLEECFLDCV